MPAPGGTTETFAFRVTDWPYTDGFGEELSFVQVKALITVWVREELVLPV